jgi:hypothetical protein
VSQSPTIRLIALSDEEQSVELYILGGEKFTGGQYYDALRVEVVISSNFTSGRKEFYVNSYDLDSWGGSLDSLASGRQVTWLESGRSPRFTIVPDEASDSGCTEVGVFDVTDSQIHVVVPVAAPESWIDQHRSMLEDIKNQFPLTRK